MIILHVDGGLGSQLMKYFVGQVFSKRTGRPVKYDLSWYDKYGKSIDGKSTREFELTKVFENLEFPIATEQEIASAKHRIWNPAPYSYDPKMFDLPESVHLAGYFVHHKFLQDYENYCERPRFNRNCVDNLPKHPNRVAVHIRRGDFVGSIHDVCTPEYYIEAIKKMNEELVEATFYLFSDDWEWVEKNIVPKVPEELDCYILSAVRDFPSYTPEYWGETEFFFISQMNHQITSNANFGYLGAFMNRNPNKKVIIPRAWIRNRQTREIDYEASKAYYMPGYTVL